MANGKYKDWITPEGLVRLTGWARDGLTDEQIAHNIGIRRTTLYDWKKKYSDISDALKKGKEVVDYEVESALLKRGLGYEVVEKTTTVDDDGITERETIKHIAGDTTALIFWLKNRRPDKWRDRQDVNLSGGIKENPFKGMNKDEARKHVAKLEKGIDGGAGSGS